MQRLSDTDSQSRDDVIHRFGDIVLARLLVAPERALANGRLSRDIAACCGLASVESSSLLEAALRERSDLDQVRLDVRDRPQLNASGSAAALAFVGLQRLPVGLDWKGLRATYLVARAIGLATPSSLAAQRRVVSAAGLKAAILRQAYALPTDDYPTLAEARAALAWLRIGRSTREPFRTRRVLDWVLSNELSVQVEPPARLAGLVAMTLAGKGAGIAALRHAILRTWLTGDPSPGNCPAEVRRRSSEPHGHPSPPTLQAASFDLASFAARVRRAASSCTTGRFGDDKVFISHVWRALVGEPSCTDLFEFKRRLVEAAREGLVALSRADLVQAMDSEDVSVSEVQNLNARFHFIRTAA